MTATPTAATTQTGLPPHKRRYITVPEAVEMSYRLGRPYSEPTVRKYARRYKFGYQRVRRGRFLIHTEKFRRWLCGKDDDTNGTAG